MILATLAQLKAFLADQQKVKANRKLAREARRAVRQGGGPGAVEFPNKLNPRSVAGLNRALQRAGGVARLDAGPSVRASRRYFVLQDGTHVLTDLSGNVITTRPPQ